VAVNTQGPVALRSRFVMAPHAGKDQRRTENLTAKPLGNNRGLLLGCYVTPREFGAIVFDLRVPSATSLIEVNPTMARSRPGCHSRCVLDVHLVSDNPQVRQTVVEPVPVDVVHHIASGHFKQKSMQSFPEAVRGIAGRVQVPRVVAYGGNVNRIDLRPANNLTLATDRDQADHRATSSAGEQVGHGAEPSTA
jgi:hypothetical protein